MRRRGRIAWLAGLLALAALPGCRDEIAAPTQGFVEARTLAGVPGSQQPMEPLDDVTIVVTGEPLRTEITGLSGEGRLGPLPAGTYLVTASRPGYDVVPADGLEVEVRAAETAVVDFTLLLREVGAVDVSARNAVTGEEVVGAEIWVERSGGFTNTGETTPGRVEDLPIGLTTFEIRDPAFALDPSHETASFDVQIETGVLAQVEVDVVPPRAVLGEMFTYQTCPNCPPSAEKLKELHEDHPGRVYVIEWHTWDHQSFDLFSADGKVREAAYGGGQTVGWPAVVVQGELPLIIGGGAASLAEYEDRANEELAECAGDCDFAIDSSATTANVFAKVLFRGGNQPSSLVLRFVQIEQGVVAPGNQPYFDFVARDYAEYPVSFSGPGDVVEQTAPFGDPGDDWDYVVYLQSDDTLEILAVHGSH